MDISNNKIKLKVDRQIKIKRNCYLVFNLI